MEHNKLIFSKVPTLRFCDFIEDWTQLPFGLLATYKKGPFGSALTKSIFVPKSENTVKVYEQQNAINKDWTLSRYYITNEYYQKMKSFTVHSGDIIVSCAGTIGESYVIPNDAETGIINQALMIIRTNEKVNKTFYLYLFNKVIKAFSEKYSNGSAIKNIPPFSDLKSFRVAIPTIEEQNKISMFLSLIDDRITVQNKIISKYETLIKGLSYYIIKKFNGKEYKLGTLAEIYQPQTITKTDLPDNGKYPVYGANGIIGYYDRFNHKESQIMITCRGSTCGTVNLSTPYSWITGNSMVINIDEHKSIVDKKYLYYYLKTQSFNDLISGSGQPQIVRKPLVNLNVFLPKISQQIKLREIIDTFEKTLKNEKEMLSALQKQKAFLLQSMFI